MLTVEEILAAPAMLAERIETERLTTRNDVLSPEEQTASDEARVQVLSETQPDSLLKLICSGARGA